MQPVISTTIRSTIILSIYGDFISLLLILFSISTILKSKSRSKSNEIKMNSIIKVHVHINDGYSVMTFST